MEEYMLASELRERDYSDNRVYEMQDVLDTAEIDNAMRAFFQGIIMPFADSNDWVRIAEWNCNSIYGAFARHLDACKNSLDKTMGKLKQAYRSDTGTEISTQEIDKWLFTRNVQELNIKRAEKILDAFKLQFENAFGQKFVPPSKSSNKNVSSEELKQYNIARLKEALGEK